MTKEIKTDAFGSFETPEVKIDLPPAGDARREILAERTDKLEEQADEKYKDRGAIPEDCDALRPERNREIQHHIRKGYLDIGADHPLYKTKWVNYVNQNSEKVWQAKADGWQVASIREFPEAADLAREDSTIRVGDVMLLFIRLDQYLAIEQREKQKRLRQQYGVEAEIHDLAERTNRGKGQAIFAGVSTPELGESGQISPAARQKMATRNAAQKTALNHLGNKMKEGLIPGVPIT